MVSFSLGRGRWVAAAGILSACQPDVAFRQDLKVGEAAFPQIEVEPASHDFGSLTSAEDGEVTFVVSNQGFSSLMIDDLTLDGVEGFAIAPGGALPLLLPPGETWSFDARFQPQSGGSAEAVVTVWSSDPDRPGLAVPLSGEGALPQLQITPDPVNFRTVSVPCSRQQSVTLENVGPEPLRIQRATLSGPSVDGVGLRTTLPVDLSLEQGQAVDLVLAFEADDAMTVDGLLTVESTDPRGPRSVQLTGSARFVSTGQTRFTVPPPERAHFLFAVDQSGSMGDVQTQLTTNFSSFIQALSATNSDWHLGVVTGEGSPSGYCLTGGGWLTPQSPNLEQTFSTRARQGNDWSLHMNPEALMALVDGALARTSPGQCNHGFVSGQGPLHIVVISDERDQSADQNSGGYLTRWRNVAGPGQPMRVHAIVDLTYGDDDCGFPPDGPGIYLPAAQMSGGMAFHICHANWAQALAQIAQSAVVDRRSVALADANPHPASLEVRVDGQLLTSGWSYDPVANHVVFDTPLADGQSVVIDYGLAPNCP